MEIAFNLSGVQLLQLLVAVILPLVVGIVTTRVTSPGRKAVALLLLSVVSSLLTELLASAHAGTTYDLGAGLILALTSFLIGVGMHYGIWKPTGVSIAVQENLGPTEIAKGPITPDVNSVDAQSRLYSDYSDYPAKPGAAVDEDDEGEDDEDVVELYDNVGRRIQP